MPRTLLFHWNAAEAKERAERLRRDGYKVDTYTKQDGAGLRALKDKTPDAFVIDLGRLPSHGKAVATALRQQKGTRLIPIIFAGGEPAKVAQVREAIPDAVYTAWRGINGALTRAIKSPLKEPVVPETFDYSKTPLPKKLGIKAGAVVALLDAPTGFDRALGTLPANVRLRRRMWGRVDQILLFAKSHAELEHRFPAAAKSLSEGGGIWIIWPKKTSKVDTDLTQPVVRAFGMGAGFVDYKICAVDETWSGLLFARRKSRT